MSAQVRHLAAPLAQQTSLADFSHFSVLHTHHQMDCLTLNTEQYTAMPRRSLRNLERTNRATIFHTGVFLSVASDTENDSDPELIEEDPPSPGPSVPNGKIIINIYIM